MYYMDVCVYLSFFYIYKTAGKVDLEELISAFMDLGIEVDMEEARHLLSRFANCTLFFIIMDLKIFLLLHRMDQDGSLNISYNEWRDFLLLAPSSDIHDLIKFWRHSTVSSDHMLPPYLVCVCLPVSWICPIF